MNVWQMTKTFRIVAASRAAALLCALAALLVLLAVCRSASAFSAVVTANASNQAGDGYGTGASTQPLVSCGNEVDLVTFKAIPTNLDQVNECKVDGPFTFSWKGTVYTGLGKQPDPSELQVSVTVPTGAGLNVSESCTVTGHYEAGQPCTGPASATGNKTVYLVGLGGTAGQWTQIYYPFNLQDTAPQPPTPAPYDRIVNLGMGVERKEVGDLVTTRLVEQGTAVYSAACGDGVTITDSTSITVGGEISLYGLTVGTQDSESVSEAYNLPKQNDKRFKVQLITPAWTVEDRRTGWETRVAGEAGWGPWVPTSNETSPVGNIAFIGSAYAIWGECCQ